MKSLLNFIIKYHYFILFILIECFSIILVIQNNDYHRASFLNSSSGISGKVYSMFHSASQYIDLKTANQDLNKSLVAYRNTSKTSYKKSKIQIIDIFDSVYIQQYKFIPAQVINNSINKRNNYLTLNVGRNNGVLQEMAVVSSNGVVGVVKDVSDNFASVISILNQNLIISAMVKHSGYIGSLNWDGNNYKYAKMGDLPNHIAVKKGDTIVTSGYSAMFPKGEFIGLVHEVDDTKSSDFRSLSVKLAVDFKNISHVMVINNLLKEEQINLENPSSND